MDAKEIIRKYHIEDAHDGTIRIGVPRGQKLSSGEMDMIKAAKPEILAYFAAERAAEDARRKAREDKINAIEGLAEIRNAIEAEDAYRRAFDHMMEDEYNDGACPPSKPEVNSAELKKQYPRAAAYIKTENWEYASHYVKSGAGSKAKERIINGEDYIAVLADMETEWSAHCTEHIWD